MLARRFCLLAGLASLALPVAPARAAIPFKAITSNGPLTTVAVGNEGSCQVAHAGDQLLELFPSDVTPADCGTFIFAGGVLYGPNFPGHDRSAASSVGGNTPLTPVSQSEVGGSGTTADPLRVTTVFTADPTGLRVTQVDSYVPGSEAYRTDIQIQNTGAAAQSGILYRAGDCYLQNSDVGFGFVEASTNGPGCSIAANNSPPNRIEQWVPLTSGSSYLEDNFSTVWAAIGAHNPFPNTCRCNDAIDNGAGLSWSFNIAPGATAGYSHLTVFSPTGVTGGQQQQPQPQPQPPRVPSGPAALPLPSSRRCTSRRAFPIRVRKFAGVRYSFAIVAVNGRRVPVYVYTERRIRVNRIGATYLNSTRRFRAFVDLRGLVRGTYRVRVTAVTTNGAVVTNTRRYRTCTRRLVGTIPPL